MRAGKTSPVRRRKVVWMISYIAVAGSPLLVFAGSAVTPRRLAVECSTGLGLVALALLCLQFALSARVRRLAASIGLDTVLQLHRQAAWWAAAFAAGHVALLAFEEPWYVTMLLDVRERPATAAALSFVPLGLLALLIVPRRFARLRASYESWRVTHALLAIAVVLVALWHVVSIGTIVSGSWRRAALAALVGLAVSTPVITHVARPALALRRRWRVLEVVRERERVWTLGLEAVGHEGMRFRAGQAVWLTLGDDPWSARTHPFTIASSAESPARIELTIKELGDFTSNIGSTAAGTCAFLDGPYGAFTLDAAGGQPLVLVAGGIGITPMMSMLRTMRDRGDPRAVLLVYGSVTQSKIVFREELEALARTLDLRVVHVLEHPESGWAGASGTIGRELLVHNLDAPEYAGAHFFSCGPEPMTNAVERLLRAEGIGAERIHSEHFVFLGSRPAGPRSLRELEVRAWAFRVALLLAIAVVAVAAARAM